MSMAILPVKLKPGPVRIAAALSLAGFAQSVLYPTVTDACGKIWTSPSALLIAMGVVGGESSGHALAFNINYSNGVPVSTDYGLLEINDHFSPEYFGAIKSPLQGVWSNYVQNCNMAYNLYSKAVTARKAANGPMTDDWKPWHAFSNGGYKAERFAKKSWLSWGQFGIQGMNAELAQGLTLNTIAGIDLDPLVY